MSSREDLAARLMEEYGITAEDGEEDVEYAPLAEGSRSSDENTSDEEEEEDIDTDEFETDDDAEDLQLRVERQAEGEEITLSQHDLARLIMLTQSSSYGSAPLTGHWSVER